MHAVAARRPPFLRSLAALVPLWAVACAGAAAAEETERPNVLVILADDLGYGDVSCYNPESRIATPNLDRLASQGMRFTDAHTPCTVCTPTRYGLLTGQMPFRVPNGGRVFSGAGGPSLIAPGKLTLPEMLRQEGYATACVGKWHLGLTFYDEAGEPIHNGGPDGVKRIDYARRIDGGPLDCGFDTFFGTACCPTTDWLYAYIDGARIPLPPTGRLDKSTLPRHPYANDNRPGFQAPDFDLETVDLEFLERSQTFLREHVANTPERPFFLFHSAQAVHLPSFPADPFKGKSGAGPHGDFILELDAIVGALMKTLDELGLAENTLVLFTSDNGPEVPTVYHMRHDHDHDGSRPWRGVKRDNWEGGHRVPFIARWPGRIAPGSVSDELVSLTDVMATAADIVGYELPNDAAEDSFSLRPVLSSEPSEPSDGPVRPYLLVQGFRGRGTLALRRGDWAYLDHPGSGGNNYANHPQLREYQLPEPAPEARYSLYNLAMDPGQQDNVADEEPQVLAEMQALLKATKETGRSVPRRD
ncbi:arylsulfatase [Alienimonas sp. DA493]|uniref:sulfatase family protein n=1 Tax=Alienimonas sp. DA493 TaxID=3373605 RepID=UPI0037543495